MYLRRKKKKKVNKICKKCWQLKFSEYALLHPLLSTISTIWFSHQDSVYLNSGKVAARLKEKALQIASSPLSSAVDCRTQSHYNTCFFCCYTNEN